MNSKSFQVAPSLLKRADHEAYNELIAGVDTRGAKFVEMGQTVFQSFESKAMIGSKDFNDCLGLVIETPKGAIVGRYPVGDHGIGTARVGLPGVLAAHKASLSDANIYIYARVSYRKQSESVTDKLKNGVKSLSKQSGFAHDTLKDRLKSLIKQSVFVHDKEKDELITLVKNGLGLGVVAVKAIKIVKYIAPLDILQNVEDDMIDKIGFDPKMAGALLVENNGGGSAETKVTFVDLCVQLPQKDEKCTIL